MQEPAANSIAAVALPEQPVSRSKELAQYSEQPAPLSKELGQHSENSVQGQPGPVPRLAPPVRSKEPVAGPKALLANSNPRALDSAKAAQRWSPASAQRSVAGQQERWDRNSWDRDRNMNRRRDTNRDRNTRKRMTGRRRNRARRDRPANHHHRTTLPRHARRTAMRIRRRGSPQGRSWSAESPLGVETMASSLGDLRSFERQNTREIYSGQCRGRSVNYASVSSAYQHASLIYDTRHEIERRTARTRIHRASRTSNSMKSATTIRASQRRP